MKITLELCRYLTALSPEYMAEDLLEDIRYKTLDWLGCVIGAIHRKSSQSILEMVREAGGNPKCSAFGLTRKTSICQAAFLNGILGHTLEYDDVNKIAITHPGAVAVPAALAAAEYCGAGFEQYALGVTAGYEVMIRLGTVLNPSHYDYWHTAGTCGTFAAAAAAAKVMDLDTDRMAKSLGMAGTMAAGLVCVFGTDAKLVTVGNAVENGVKAAILAKQGYSAPEDVIEREGGYAQAVSREKKIDDLYPREGDELKIRDSYYKLHASCGHTHSALDALERIMRKHYFKVEQVEMVRIKAYKKAVELTGSLEWDTELKAKFSMPYCIAVMILYGETGTMQFTDQVRNAPQVRELGNRIRVEEEVLYTKEYPALRMERVKVTLKDGQHWEEEVKLPRGKFSWKESAGENTVSENSLQENSNREMSPGECIRKKFISLAGLTVDRSQASRIMELVLSQKGTMPIEALTAQIRGELNGS